MPNPIIRQISAFDANEGSYLEFAVPNNTEQIYGSGIIIRDNDTNEIIYKEGINDEDENRPYSSMLYKHPLTKDMNLKNGKVYNIILQTYNRDFSAVLGTTTTPQLLRCYTKPIFSLNISKEQIIGSSSINPMISYSQTEGEELYESVIYVYDSDHKKIHESSTLYDIKGDIPIYGLMGGTYYIQAKGLTEFGTILDTGLIRFFIQYSIPSPTAILSAVNVPQKASIQLRSNIHAIFYTVGDENIKYIDDSSIDLRENHVNYNNGINVTGDFLLVVKLRNCNDYISPVVTIFDNTNTYQTGNINFKRYDSYGKVLSDGSIDWDDIELTKGYFNFEIETDFGILSLNTDMFEYPEDTGWIYTCLSRIGNLYDLIIILEDGTVIT